MIHLHIIFPFRLGHPVRHRLALEGMSFLSDCWFLKKSSCSVQIIWFWLKHANATEFQKAFCCPWTLGCGDFAYLEVAGTPGHNPSVFEITIVRHCQIRESFNRWPQQATVWRTDTPFLLRCAQQTERCESRTFISTYQITKQR
jgi:hypothetical protein